MRGEEKRLTGRGEGEAGQAREAKDKKRWRQAALLVPAVVGLIINLLHGPFIVDDTYIGLRYAENFARGHGLVFNPGEPVLGVSSPLYVLLLGLCRKAGMELPFAARFLTILFVFLLMIFFQLIALRSLRPLYALAAGLLTAAFPLIPFTANCGMETGMSMAAIYGTFYFLLSGRYALAGVTVSAALQVRPDGLLLLLVAAFFIFFRDRKKLLRFALVFLLFTLPWTVAATFIYGSPIPHTIIAKKANHYSPAGVIVERLLFVAAAAGPITLFSLPGLGRVLLRRTEMTLLTLWLLLYIFGLIYVRIDPFLFLWYLAPLLPAWVLLAADAAQSLSLWWEKRRGPHPSLFRALLTHAAAGLLFLEAIVAALFIYPFQMFLYNTGYDRVEKYLFLGDWLAARSQPGQVVYVAECGALGYKLMDRIILDGSGLNCPEIYEICHIGLRSSSLLDPRPLFNTADCDLAVLQERQPDYIAVFTLFFRVNELSQHPWFRSHYRRLDPGPEFFNYYLFEKTAPGPPLH